MWRGLHVPAILQSLFRWSHAWLQREIDSSSRFVYHRSVSFPALFPYILFYPPLSSGFPMTRRSSLKSPRIPSVITSDWYAPRFYLWRLWGTRSFRSFVIRCLRGSEGVRPDQRATSSQFSSTFSLGICIPTTEFRRIWTWPVATAWKNVCGATLFYPRYIETTQMPLYSVYHVRKVLRGCV